MARHKSDSAEQQEAESFILASVADRLSLNFDKDADLGLGVKPDGIDLHKKVVVEAYARVGQLKGAQLHKVKSDLLKLAYIDKKLGSGWRKIMCFGSQEAASFLLGSSWAAEAARSFGIEIFVEPLPREQEEYVLAAQERQRMVNPE